MREVVMAAITNRMQLDGMSALQENWENMNEVPFWLQPIEAKAFPCCFKCNWTMCRFDAVCAKASGLDRGQPKRRAGKCTNTSRNPMKASLSTAGFTEFA
jgi:hypothetical protein